ncbi:MAG: YceG family protein [Bacillales bacterium]|nr:YceG family protein [Bacillales bacterium]
MSKIQNENEEMNRYLQNHYDIQGQRRRKLLKIIGWVSLVIAAILSVWEIESFVIHFLFDKNGELPLSYTLNAIILGLSALSIFLLISKKKTLKVLLITFAVLFSVNGAIGIAKNIDFSKMNADKTEKQNNEKKEKGETPATSGSKDPKEGSGTETNPNPSAPPSSNPATTPDPNSGGTPSPSTEQQTPPPKVEVSISIPEGFTFKQIAERLEAKGVVTKAAFYTVAQTYKVQSFTIPSSANRAFNLEGYLFPDTYKFYKDDDPTAIVKKMLINYANKSGMPSDETIILASIIEKEARTTENMKLVAGVFKNRLAKGMKLEADSTREYVNKNITSNALLSDTGKFAALYNTYKCNGLPSGPISNPSTRAIQAALNPTPSEYLYFFFGKDDQNHYSKTLEEHNAQMQQFGVKFAN